MTEYDALLAAAKARQDHKIQATPEQLNLLDASYEIHRGVGGFKSAQLSAKGREIAERAWNHPRTGAELRARFNNERHRFELSLVGIATGRSSLPRESDR